MGKLVLVLSGYVLIGAPLVLFSWHEISEALLGRVHLVRLSAALAIALVLFGMLARLGRYLRGLEEQEGGIRAARAGGRTPAAGAAPRHDVDHPYPGRSE